MENASTLDTLIYSLTYSLDPLAQNFHYIMKDVTGFSISFNLYPT